MTEPERTPVMEWRCPYCEDWWIAYSTVVGNTEAPAWLARRRDNHLATHQDRA